MPNRIFTLGRLEPSHFSLRAFVLRPALISTNIGVAHPGEQIPRVIRPDLSQRQPRDVEFLRAHVVHAGEVLSVLSGVGMATSWGAKAVIHVDHLISRTGILMESFLNYRESLSCLFDW